MEVPYWWDKTKESLAATIRLQRPDLLTQYATLNIEPIPSRGVEETGNKENVGEFTN